MIKRFLPLVMLVMVMLLVYFTGIYKHLSLEEFKLYDAKIQDYVHLHPFLSPLFFTLLYVLVVALSLPGAAFLSVLAGYLFEFFFGTFYVVCAATCGASIIFLAARTALGDSLKKKAGPLFKKIEKELEENGIAHLLFLRFIPLFPFWLVNLAPAFFGIKFRTFFWTTFIGIIPGSVVFTLFGKGLHQISSFSLSGIFTLEIKTAFFLLGALALLPVLLKKLKKTDA